MTNTCVKRLRHDITDPVNVKRLRNYLSLFTFTGAVISCLDLSQSLHIYRICYIVLVTILVSSHLQDLFARYNSSCKCEETEIDPSTI
jgi:hypothetical protein